MGSGSLEQTADKVLLIYKTIEKNETKYFINLAKNRQGKTITKSINFIGEQYRFEEIPEVTYGDSVEEIEIIKMFEGKKICSPQE